MASLNHETIGEYLSAYVDDELTANEREAVEQLVLADPAVRAQLDELRQMAGLVRSLPAGQAPADLLQSLTADAERRALLDEPENAPVRRTSPWSSARQLFSMAAALLITVAGAWYVFDSMNQETDPRLAGGVSAPSESVGVDADAAGKELKADRVETNLRSDAGLSDSTVASGLEAIPASPGIPPEVGSLDGRSVAGDIATEEKDRAAGSAERRRSVRPGPLAEAESAALAPSRRVLLPAVEPSPRSYQHDAMTARLNLAQKIGANLAGDDIAGHRFDNEANKLVVVASNRGDVFRARSQVADFAFSNHLAHGNMLAMDESLAADQAVFLEGARGVNFDEQAQSQILVRAPASMLPELVEALSRGAQGERPLTVQVGPIEVSGSGPARALLRQTQPQSSLHAYHEDTERKLAAVDDEVVRSEANKPEDLYAATTLPESAKRSLAKARGDRTSGHTERFAQPTSQATTPPRRVQPERLAMVDDSDAKRESPAPDDEGNIQISSFLKEFIGGQLGSVDKLATAGEAGARSKPVEPGRLVNRKGRFREARIDGGQVDRQAEAPLNGKVAQAEELVTFIVQIVQAESNQETTSQPGDSGMPAP